jgi:pyruvate-ferredoxin/flavodoxin oxidoreductase
MIRGREDFFVVGIDHEIALRPQEDPDLRPPGAFSMRGHSVGGFGSVTTNKVIATIGGQVFGKDVQAYPKYGSEKKGLPTTYYLTIADSHIYSHSELEHVDLVVLNDTNAIFSGNPLKGMVDGGAIFMQSPFTAALDVWKRIPPHHQRTIVDKQLRVFFIDMVKIAREVASVADLEMRMQGIVLLGAFLHLTPYGESSGMGDDEIYAGVEKSLRKYFGKRGERVVEEDWWTHPKSKKVVDFIDFCRSEGRFSKQFDKEGNPSETLLLSRQDRLENWHQLQELAGII